MTTDNSLDQALQAIADPTRRVILQALKQVAAASPPAVRPASRPPLPRKDAAKGSHGRPRLCAGDIQQRVHLSQPTISHHMSILTKAGLVEETKQGQWRWYSRNETAIRKLLKLLRTKL
jgi:DNA-binding transcriptional ArsR family regulator